MRSDAHTAQAVLEALKRGPCVSGALAARIERPSSAAISGTLSWMVATGKVVEIGTLVQAWAAGVEVDVAGARRVRSVLKVFALPGTPMLPPLPGVPRPSQTKSGSGVVAGPKVIRGYLW